MIDYFLEIFQCHLNETAIIFKNKSYTYKWLLENISFWKSNLTEEGIISGQVVALNGDFTPNSICILFALINNKNIIVPFDFQYILKNEKKMKIAFVSRSISVNDNDEVVFSTNKSLNTHSFYEKLRELDHPGLVLFTSGTSGEPKAAVHDFVKLLEKFKTRKKAHRTLNFLLFDHWGGLNTMFHTLSNGGVVLALKDRRPQEICSFIEKHKIELLPASPSFLNLLLISEEYKNYNLNSLKLITYGTEPMPQSTLERLKAIFPSIKLQQTYGLIELGVLRSRSKNDNSLWVKVGGEGFETRVVNDLLEIKAESAMIGYLNAISPFTEDGWFMTGDQVEVDGEFIKILGRKSEIINVGGEKVYPAEVENVIQELDNVAEVTVFSEKNPIMGNIVCARVRLIHEEEKKIFIMRLKKYCREKLQSFKVPVKIILDNETQVGDRFKKQRLTENNNI
jgi:long-chain acyl-CoA synthetase